MLIEDQPRSGHPSTSRTDENVETVFQAICEDCCLIEEMAEMTVVSWSTYINMYVVSTYINGKCEDETVHHKICALPSHRGAKIETRGHLLWSAGRSPK